MSRLEDLIGTHSFRARIAGLPATLTVEQWTHTIADFGGFCAYCGTAATEVIEHFIPTVRGGGTTVGNCLPACDRCNKKKGGRHAGKVFPEVYEKLRRYLASRSNGPDTGPVEFKPPQWRAGTVADVLGLSPVEAAIVEIRFSLCNSLKARLAKFRITRRELARRMGLDPVRAGMILSGGSKTSIDLLMLALDATGATMQDIADAIEPPPERVTSPEDKKRPKAKATRVQMAAKTARTKKAR